MHPIFFGPLRPFLSSRVVCSVVTSVCEFFDLHTIFRCKLGAKSVHNAKMMPKYVTKMFFIPILRTQRAPWRPWRAFGLRSGRHRVHVMLKWAVVTCALRAPHARSGSPRSRRSPKEFWRSWRGVARVFASQFFLQILHFHFRPIFE